MPNYAMKCFPDSRTPVNSPRNHIDTSYFDSGERITELGSAWWVLWKALQEYYLDTTTDAHVQIFEDVDGQWILIHETTEEIKQFLKSHTGNFNNLPEGMTPP